MPPVATASSIRRWRFFPMEVNLRVLVVEDEARLAENLMEALREGAGFAVDRAQDGIEGEDLALQGHYDAIILDLMLPGQDGMSMLKRIRDRKNMTPVLILTAREGTDSIIKLLNAGADDYLTKPFDLGELMARIKVLIRRGKGGGSSQLKVFDLEINTVEQIASRNGRMLDLTRTEYRILEYLMHRPRALISKQNLLEHLYDYNWAHHSNVIEAHMSNLRRKLNAGSSRTLIETVRQRGYRLEAIQEPPC
jgi:two-component system response regulator PhoP